MALDSSQDRLLTTDHAATVLGISPAFLRKDRVTQRHSIPYVRIGTAVRYRYQDLIQWIGKHKEEGDA